MGMNGGGTSPVTAHVHTNASGQGGALNTTTLIGAVTLDSRLIWDLIETYEASIAEGSKTFTFTEITFDDDSELVLVMDGAVTASLALEIAVNGDTTTNYFTDGRRISAGTETIIDINSAEFWTVASTSILGIANQNFFGNIRFMRSKALTLDRPNMISEFIGAGQEQVSCQLTSVETGISSIEVNTSTSTWGIGTRFSLYRVRRP